MWLEHWTCALSKKIFHPLSSTPTQPIDCAACIAGSLPGIWLRSQRNILRWGIGGRPLWTLSLCELSEAPFPQGGQASARMFPLACLQSSLPVQRLTVSHYLKISQLHPSVPVPSLRLHCHHISLDNCLLNVLPLLSGHLLPIPHSSWSGFHCPPISSKPLNLAHMNTSDWVLLVPDFGFIFILIS